MGYNRVKKIMKKRILLLSVLMTLGVATFLSSCKKDKDDDRDETTRCECTVYDEWLDNGYWESDSYVKSISLEELRKYGITCSEWEEEFYEDCYDGDYGEQDEVNCKEV